MIQFLFLLVALIVVVYFLAKFIIKYVPKKLHWLISLLLLVISGYLSFKIYDGIDSNIKFHKEKEIRYAKVIDKLKIIRDAENAYKKGKGSYTNDFNKLIQFIETDSIAITQSREASKKVMDRGVEVVVEYKVIDTIGFVKVAKKFKGKDYKNMMNVPGTSAKFELKADHIIKGITETKTPVFEAKVAKKTVLAGLPEKLIKQEITAVAIDEVRGEYISVGTLEDVKDSGNWPPTYDIEDTNKE
jgi:hypothetical protein